jgi:hypothetical protein
MKKGMLLIAVLVMFLGVSIQARLAQAEGTSTVEQEKSADLAQELTNPLADLMTIPIQMNYDQDIGLGDEGEKLQTNIQPVIPFSLNEDWNLISRTILPVTYQDDIFPGEGSQFGLGDINLSLFFFAQETDFQCFDLGCRACFAPTDSYGFNAWRQKVGGGTHRCCADDARTVDHGFARKPYLVLCRRR